MENNEEYQKWLDEVSDRGWKLRDVPDEFKTYDLCWEAVSGYGLALEFVPDEFKTPELCLMAVNDCHWALEFAPEEFKEELAEKYDINLPEKTDERGR